MIVGTRDGRIGFCEVGSRKFVTFRLTFSRHARLPKCVCLRRMGGIPGRVSADEESQELEEIDHLAWPRACRACGTLGMV